MESKALTPILDISHLQASFDKLDTKGRQDTNDPAIMAQYLCYLSQTDSELIEIFLPVNQGFFLMEESGETQVIEFLQESNSALSIPVVYKGKSQMYLFIRTKERAPESEDIHEGIEKLNLTFASLAFSADDDFKSRLIYGVGENRTNFTLQSFIQYQQEQGITILDKTSIQNLLEKSKESKEKSERIARKEKSQTAEKKGLAFLNGYFATRLAPVKQTFMEVHSRRLQTEPLNPPKEKGLNAGTPKNIPPTNIEKTDNTASQQASSVSSAELKQHEGNTPHPSNPGFFPKNQTKTPAPQRTSNLPLTVYGETHCLVKL